MMATQKQIDAARRNILKAQKAWQGMAPEERARSQPEGRRRIKPGRSGKGDYYHVEVRDKYQFELFRNHDVGAPGGVQRVAGKRPGGPWDTLKWLIAKDHAHVTDGKLIADTDDAKQVFEQLGSEPVHVKGDIFRAKPRPDVPEDDKPTAPQQPARDENIHKARRWRHGDNEERRPDHR